MGIKLIKYSFDKKLEGLRGLCALNVALAHLFSFNFFGAYYTTIYSPVMHLQFAHIAVLLFFIISGYVMGINHIQTSFTYTNVIDYLKKRIVRLYPIYLFSTVIIVMLGYNFVTLHQIIGHLFFLQGIFIKTITSNVVLWTLSYEVIYYLIFMAIWALSKHSKNYYLALILLIFIYALGGTHFTAFKSVLIGWGFWLFGLYISRLSFDEDKKINYKPIISYFLILLATINLSTGGFILRLLHIDSANELNIIRSDFVFLPICIVIFLSITQRNFKYINWIKLIAYLLPAFNVLALIYFKHYLLSDEGWIYGITCFCLAIPFLFVKININLFEKLNAMGKISYAIYVFHFPVGFFLSLYLTKYLSGLPLLIIGIVCWVIITYGLSYYAEIIIQPYIKRYFFSKKSSQISNIQTNSVS